MHRVRPIPYTVRDKAKAVLDYMVARGIIKKVGDEPKAGQRRTFLCRPHALEL